MLACNMLQLENNDPVLSTIVEELVEKARRGQLETAWRMNISLVDVQLKGANTV